jgi:hypothetical protein
MDKFAELHIAWFYFEAWKNSITQSNMNGDSKLFHKYCLALGRSSV